MRTDLNYLRTMSGEDAELMKEMIDIFVEQVKDIRQEMQKYLDDRDFVNLGKLAHKAKSSVAIMGMNDLAKELKDLETLTKKNEKAETYQQYIDRFENECADAEKELRVFQKSLD